MSRNEWRATPPGLEDEIHAAEERAKATRLDNDNVALEISTGGSLMRMPREDHVELRHLAGNLAGDREARMGDRHDEVGPFPGAQLLDEIAQALDPGRVHSPELRRRLTPAGSNIGDADERHFYPLPLESERGSKEAFAADLS